MRFTEQQQSVIDDRGHDLLVSAAAGSGKTAVLVERIVNRVCDEDGADIDRLLVMTFTREAASQMRQRLSKRLAERLDEAILAGDTDKAARIRRQSSLLRGAHIGTIDSFCVEVLRSNFNAIGLDPSFRVAPDAELKLLRREVMDSLLEEEYKQGERPFTEFVEAFCPGNSDREAEEIITKLYDYSRAKSDPEDWLMSCAESYGAKTVEELFSSAVVGGFYESGKRLIRRAWESLCEACRVASLPAGPYTYIDTLESSRDALESVVELSENGGSHDEIRAALMAVSFGRFTGPKKGDVVDEDLKELVTNLRDYGKTAVAKLKEDYYGSSQTYLLKGVMACSERAEELVRLVIKFGRMFTAAKQQRRIVDYSDLEQYALDVFYERDSAGKRGNKPSAVADSYREYFHEIYVDEYQDSNRVQESLLQAICKKEPEKGNLFMVGDVKQSIYRFRLATPALFVEKNNTYEVFETKDNTQARNRRIDLNKNFRSRRQVIDTVNYLFETLMVPDVGGVSYDEEARLVYGADYEGKIKEDSTSYEQEMWGTELLLVEQDKEINKIELEAVAVADRIRELMKGQMVVDESTGGLRRVRYSDITVLLRTMKGWEGTFKKIFEARGIPAYSESGEGFFSGYEVRTLLDMLTVIDNPCNDEALCAVMKGYFGGFEDQELAIIRAAHPDDGFYNAIECYETTENKALQEKLQNLRKLISSYEEMSTYMTVRELLSRLVKEKGFSLSVLAMDNGEVRARNLSMLLERAAEYEQTSYKGLYNFINYIERLKKYDVDFGQSQISSAQDDVVRIMSIHKSKGLEFPICIVAGLGKDINVMDTTGALIMDSEGGIGMDHVDIDLRTKKTTVIKKALARHIKCETYGEELRVFYVALTRAKEKLIMSTILTSRCRTRIEKNNITGLEEGGKQPLDGDTILEKPSYIDWVVEALCHDAEFNKLGKSIIEGDNGCVFVHPHGVPLNIKLITSKDLVNEEVDTRVSRSELREDYLKQIEENLKNGRNYDSGSSSDRYENEMLKNMAWTYKNDAGKNNDLYIPMKVSVSTLKHLAMEEKDTLELVEEHEDYVNLPEGDNSFDYVNPNLQAENIDNGCDIRKNERNDQDSYVNQIPQEPVPLFIKKQAGEAYSEAPLIGSLRGSAYHRMFELLNYGCDLSLDDISAQIKEFAQTGFLDQSQADVLKSRDFYRFIQSDIGRRMKAAALSGSLKREQPFCVLIPADRVNSAFPAEEEILVQGIIDALFMEEGEYVIVDYKTDNVKAMEELADLYSTQLRYYAMAIEQITGVPVKERVIYSVKMGDQIRV